MKESFIKRFVEQTIQIYNKPRVRFTQKGKIGRLHLFFALKNRFLKKRGNWRKKEKNAGNPAFFRVHLFCTHYVVEATGVEPVSENPLTQLSSWVVYLLKFPLTNADRQAFD